MFGIVRRRARVFTRRCSRAAHPMQRPLLTTEFPLVKRSPHGVLLLLAQRGGRHVEETRRRRDGLLTGEAKHKIRWRRYGIWRRDLEEDAEGLGRGERGGDWGR